YMPPSEGFTIDSVTSLLRERNALLPNSTSHSALSSVVVKSCTPLLIICSEKSSICSSTSRSSAGVTCRTWLSGILSDIVFLIVCFIGFTSLCFYLRDQTHVFRAGFRAAVWLYCCAAVYVRLSEGNIATG